MKGRSRAPGWLLLLAVLALLGAGLHTAWRAPRGPLSLSEISALARRRQFDQAQEQLGRYLRVFPKDRQAHLLMAQFATDRPEPQPELALEHLAQIQGGTPREQAVVLFYQGKAAYQQREYDLAEHHWKEALKIDPTVPEAGWTLIDLLDLEGRTEEAHQLAMRLYHSEPDPRDRVRLLLEMVRLDIDQIAPGSRVQIFEPALKAKPDSLPLALAVGLALVHDSRPAQGIEVLAEALRRHPESPEAWDGWLTGLADGFEPERLREEYARLPKALADDPRFAKHEGAVAQGMEDWPRAAAAYRRAYAHEPFNGVVLYKLRMALRALGNSPELGRIDEALVAYQTAFKSLRGVHTEALAVPTLGIAPHTELYRRLAALCEQVGRYDEASAWHRLILRDVPDDPLSLAALARLK